MIPGDFLSEQKLRALDGVAALPLLAPGFGTRLLGLAYLTGIHREMAKAVSTEASAEQFIDLPAFAQALEAHQPGDRSLEFLAMGTILSRFQEKKVSPYRRLLNEFTIAPDRWMDNDEDPTTPGRWVRAQDQRSPLACDLPLWRLLHNDKPLKDPDDTKPQKRYLVEVRLVVEDTYLEGEIDPKTKLPIAARQRQRRDVYLRGHAGKRAAGPDRRGRGDRVIASCRRRSSRCRTTSTMCATWISPCRRAVCRPAEVNAFVARCDSLSETLKTSQQDTKAVAQAYERILRELRTNQLREDVINKVYKTIYAPLLRVADFQFEHARMLRCWSCGRCWRTPIRRCRPASRRPDRRRRMRRSS